MWQFLALYICMYWLSSLPSFGCPTKLKSRMPGTLYPKGYCPNLVLDLANNRCHSKILPLLRWSKYHDNIKLNSSRIIFLGQTYEFNGEVDKNYYILQCSTWHLVEWVFKNIQLDLFLFSIHFVLGHLSENFRFTHSKNLKKCLLFFLLFFITTNT